MRQISTVLLALALLTGCSGVKTALPPVGPQPAEAGSAPVAFTVVVPSGAPRQRARFISPSTQSIVVTLQARVVLRLDVSASSKACVAAARGARHCTARGHAPVGMQTFDVVAYDGAKGTGNVLASGAISAQVAAGAAPVRISLMGKPASISLALDPAYPRAGSATRANVDVAVLDADGNTIVGAYAGGVTLTDSDASGATKLSTTTVADSSTRIMLAYDGAPLDQAAVFAKAQGVPNAGAIFAPAPTTVATYAVPWLHYKGRPFRLGVFDLCYGPDGNIWATGASSGAILKVDKHGKFTIYPLVGTEPVGISVGSDKNLWFAEEQGGKIGKITPSGTITNYPIPAHKGEHSQPVWTALGPDGRIWFAEQGFNANAMGAISTDGKIAIYPLPNKVFPIEMVSGPDGNLWITDGGTNAILKMSAEGKVLARYTVPTPDSAPWGITVGPDKNIWFAEFNGNKIGKMTISGKLREFVVPTSFAGPLNVAAGPDGNVWFTETGDGIWDFVGKVGYVTTDGSVIRDFPSGAHVHNLAFDSAGNLWFSKFSRIYSSMVKFDY